MCTIADRISQIRKGLPRDVELVAVSKFHPASAIRQAYAAGQRIFAESRPQEFKAKVQELSSDMTPQGEPAYADINWHFIGHLQTNKLKMVLPYVSMVESVDSIRLLEAIDSWGRAEGRVTDILLECHVAAEQTKQGFTPEEITSILSSWKNYPGVRFRGLMGMATFTDDEAVIRSDFSALKTLYDSLEPRMKADGADYFDRLSMGMSEDYLLALDCGTTTVRIGTAIFGPRAY